VLLLDHSCTFIDDGTTAVFYLGSAFEFHDGGRMVEELFLGVDELDRLRERRQKLENHHQFL
jgi:hypothetical protein